jgi:transcriptional regulator with XRE-family HTH domain
VPKQSPVADKALAAVLRRLRIDRGLSQQTLANRAGITTSALARIELCQANPTWATARDIASALGVSLTELAAAVESER